MRGIMTEVALVKGARGLRPMRANNPWGRPERAWLRIFPPRGRTALFPLGFAI